MAAAAPLEPLLERLRRPLARRITLTRVSIPSDVTNLSRAHIRTALDSVESKFGGGKVDPEKMRSTNEKITDGVRDQFEKATGYGLPRLVR